MDFLRPRTCIHAKLLIIFVFLAAVHTSDSYDDSLYYTNSDLTSKCSGSFFLDLVAGVTEISICNTMTAFLQQIEEPPQIFYYKLGGDDFDEYIYVSREDSIDELGFDLFDIPPDATCKSDPRLEKAFDEFYYELGYWFEYGIPNVDPLQLPNPVQFLEAGSKVIYNMVMKEFKGFDLKYDRQNGCRMDYISQDDWFTDPANEEGYPLIFRFDINLDIRHEDPLNMMDDLPEETQRMILDLGPGMFSISQLFMLLNTASLRKGLPCIPNMDPYSPWSILLSTLLKVYLDHMDPDGNGVMFGYEVEAHEPPPPEYEPTVVPTSLTFWVSPHRNMTDGKPTDSHKYSVYTLNYWMSTESRWLASPSSFAWNWVEYDEREEWDGVMTVRREIFSKRLAESLNTEMGSRLCYHPIVEVTTCGAFYVSYERDVDRCLDARRYIAMDGTDGLVLEYADSDSASGECRGGMYMYWKSEVSVRSYSRVYFRGSEIRIVSGVEVHIMGTCKEHFEGTSGSFAYFESVSVYAISVDSRGKIKTELKSSRTEDLSDQIIMQPDGCKPDEFEANMRALVADVDDLEDMLSGYAGVVDTVLNGQSLLIFPGGNTFTFEDAMFSDTADLMSRIKYNTPESRLIYGYYPDDDDFSVRTECGVM